MKRIVRLTFLRLMGFLVGSLGYHGNHVKFENSLFEKRLTSPPLEIGPPTKIFDRHARNAYLYLYYSGFDTKSVEMQL